MRALGHAGRIHRLIVAMRLITPYPARVISPRSTPLATPGRSQRLGPRRGRAPIAPAWLLLASLATLLGGCAEAPESGETTEIGSATLDSGAMPFQGTATATSEATSTTTPMATTTASVTAAPTESATSTIAPPTNTPTAGASDTPEATSIATAPTTATSSPTTTLTPPRFGRIFAPYVERSGDLPVITAMPSPTVTRTPVPTPAEEGWSLPIPPEDLAPGDVPYFLASWPDGTLWARIRRADGGPDRIAKRTPEPDAETVVYESLQAAVEAEEGNILFYGSLPGFWSIDDEGRIVIGTESYVRDPITDESTWRTAVVDSAYSVGERRYTDSVVVDDSGNAWVPYTDESDCTQPEGCASAGVHAFSAEGELVGAIALSPLPEAAVYGIAPVMFVSDHKATEETIELSAADDEAVGTSSLPAIEPDGTSRGAHRIELNSTRPDTAAMAAAGSTAWAATRIAAYALPIAGEPVPIYYPFLGPPPRGATSRLRNSGYHTICLLDPLGQLQVLTWVEVHAHDYVDHRIFLNTLTPFGWTVPEDLTHTVFGGSVRFERVTAAAYSDVGSLWIGMSSGRIAAKIRGEWTGLYDTTNSPLPGTPIKSLDVGFDGTVFVAVGDRVLAIADAETGPPMFFEQRVPERVVASSALPSWPVGRLIDGERAEWSSLGHDEHLAGAEWAALRFSSARTIRAVRIVPRVDPADATASLGFPKDFVIQHATNSAGQTCDPADPRFTNPGNWRPLVTRSGFPQPSGAALRFDVAPVSARCLRVQGTELSQDDFGNRYLQLAEVQVLTDADAIIPATVSVSSSTTGWPANRLVDGRTDTVWSSAMHREHLAGAEWAAIVLELPQPIDSVRIVPRQDPSNPQWSLGFPKDFVVQYALNGTGLTCNTSDPRFAQDSNWRPLVTRSGYSQPSSDVITFPILPVMAGCVRLFGAELSQDDYGNRYMQLAELQAIDGQDPVEVAETVVSSALASWPASRLADGRPNTVWSSRQHSGHLASSEWAAAVLPTSARVDSLRVHPRRDPISPATSLGFPQDLVVQYAIEGFGQTCNVNDPRFAVDSNWRPLVTRYGIPQPNSSAIRFAFAPRTMGCVRLLGAELSQDDFGLRYFQLSELEVLLRLGP